MSIERESHISMYTQIASILEKTIREGDLKPNQKLPSELELAEKFGVSRVTARLALQSLYEKGLVVRKQGKGTFVIDSLVLHELGSMEAFYDSFRAKDLNADLVEMKVIETPEDVLKVMGANAFLQTLHLQRLYTKNEVTVGLANVYLPSEVADNITWKIAKENSGYSLLTQNLRVDLDYARISIRAFPCNEELSLKMDIEIGDPILRLLRTSYSPDHTPIEHLKLFLRSDSFEFNMKIPGGFSIYNGLKEMRYN